MIATRIYQHLFVLSMTVLYGKNKYFIGLLDEVANDLIYRF